MNKEFQNSDGFFKTKSISTSSLIDDVANFNFSSSNIGHFSDEELDIPARLMLGKRAERYFSAWLKQSSDFDLIAENIQVIHEKQTLGEFDFIVRRKSNQQLIHVELVYKFYLFDPLAEGSEFQHWIGPNKKDRLDFKLDKLREHQFPLFFHDSAKEILGEFNVESSKVEQHVLFLANLFVPMNQEIDFKQVNKDAIEGSWMTLSEWERSAPSNHQFAMPAKTDWFSRELITSKWISKNEMIDQILSMHQQKRSPLIYSKDANDNQRRDFVVWW